MIRYPCPVCAKRVCDSTKKLALAKLTKANEREADMAIKCRGCKNQIAVAVIAYALQDT